MSFDALAWAAKQRTGSSGTKLVLMGLAECAGRKDAHAFPCIAELVEFSSLNRKSVIANLDALERGNFITDTGERVGQTKQVKVYRLNLETVPKVEPSQKRNSSYFSVKSPKNGTRNQSEPLPTCSEDKSSSQVLHSSKNELKPEQLVEAWNARPAARGAVACQRISPERRTKMNGFLRRYPVDEITEAIVAVEKSDFLCGRGGNNYRADIEFLFSPKHMNRLLEGFYAR